MYPLFFGFPLADLPGSSNSWTALHSVSGWSKWSLRAGYPRKAIVLRPDRLCDRLHELAAGQQVPPSRKIWTSHSLSTMVNIWRFRVNGETELRARDAMSKNRLNSSVFCLLATKPYLDHCVQFWELYVGGLAFKSQGTCPAFHPGTLEEHRIVHCECRLLWQSFSTSFWRMYLLKGHFRMLGASLGLDKAPWTILIFLQRAPSPIWES